MHVGVQNCGSKPERVRGLRPSGNSGNDKILVYPDLINFSGNKTRGSMCDTSVTATPGIAVMAIAPAIAMTATAADPAG